MSGSIGGYPNSNLSNSEYLFLENIEDREEKDFVTEGTASTDALTPNYSTNSFDSNEALSSKNWAIHDQSLLKTAIPPKELPGGLKLILEFLKTESPSPDHVLKVNALAIHLTEVLEKNSRDYEPNKLAESIPYKPEKSKNSLNFSQRTFDTSSTESSEKSTPSNSEKDTLEKLHKKAAQSIEKAQDMAQNAITLSNASKIVSSNTNSASSALGTSLPGPTFSLASLFVGGWNYAKLCSTRSKLSQKINFYKSLTKQREEEGAKRATVEGIQPTSAPMITRKKKISPSSEVSVNSSKKESKPTTLSPEEMANEILDLETELSNVNNRINKDVQNLRLLGLKSMSESLNLFAELSKNLAPIIAPFSLLGTNVIALGISIKDLYSANVEKNNLNQELREIKLSLLPLQLEDLSSQLQNDPENENLKSQISDLTKELDQLKMPPNKGTLTSDFAGILPSKKIAASLEISNTQTQPKTMEELKAIEKDLTKKIQNNKEENNQAWINFTLSAASVANSVLVIVAITGGSVSTLGIAATGIGAAALAGVALCYMIYRNREAIREFLISTTDSLKVMSEQLSDKLSGNKNLAAISPAFEASIKAADETIHKQASSSLDQSISILLKEVDKYVLEKARDLPSEIQTNISKLKKEIIHAKIISSQEDSVS